MDSDTCLGFKRRITEIGDDQQMPTPPTSSPSLCTVSHEDKEEQDIAENKNLSLLSDSKKSKSSSHSEASEDIVGGNQELASTSAARQRREVLDSLASGLSVNGNLGEKIEDFGAEVEKSESCEARNVCDGEAKKEKFDMVKGGFEETAKDGLFPALAGKEEKVFVKSEVGVKAGSAVEESKELGKESESLLETKKKQLLEKLEVVLTAEDKSHAEKSTDFGGSLKIKVIDQTALIDLNEKCPEWNGSVNQEVDAKKARRSRRKAKKVSEMNGKNAFVTDETKNVGPKNGGGTKKLYSRTELEALRFTNVVEQRKIWKLIYNGLDAAVAREYDGLTISKHQNHIWNNFDPRQSLAKHEEASAILREARSENKDSDMKNMEDGEMESLSPLGPTFSQSVRCLDGYIGLEEDNNEEDDSDEDYTSIQRPAFSVGGEPKFDSGPPEDGLEYLRRVRWEAAQIPKVKVAKFDRSKFNKEQSVYMPQIPDIARCAEHLLPLKQWEEAFLADFSELRQAVSPLVDSGEELSGKREPIFVNHEKCHSRQQPCNLENFSSGEDHPKQVNDFSGTERSIDLPRLLKPGDHGTSLLSEHSSVMTCADEISGPLLSVILKMDSVARVSTLRKRINSAETMNSLSRNDCLWLFALCAVVDTPLDADTCAALRSLLRKCASLRAAKSEFDEEVVMLNILVTVAGRYFGQSGS